MPHLPSLKGGLDGSADHPVKLSGQTPMHENESVTARYRRLARECLEVAHTFPAGERRTVLLQMAQVWQRLAHDYPESSAPLSHAFEPERPVIQQQQQVQPKDKDKKE
jgi:hypothetical protein